jgi:hypothetical protein
VFHNVKSANYSPVGLVGKFDFLDSMPVYKLRKLILLLVDPVKRTKYHPLLLLLLHMPSLKIAVAASRKAKSNKRASYCLVNPTVALVEPVHLLTAGLQLILINVLVGLCSLFSRLFAFLVFVNLIPLCT